MSMKKGTKCNGRKWKKGESKVGLKEPGPDSFIDVKNACTVWLFKKGLGAHPWEW